MIQAPQTQYIPSQQMMMPTGYQQQGVNQAIQSPQQTQGYYYNYPTSSCYTQGSAGKSQYNGVNIEIINPQGQGVVPQNGYTMPAQYVPVQQSSVMMPQYQQPFAPVYQQPFPASQAIVQAPQIPQQDSQAAPMPIMPQTQPAAYQPAAPQAQPVPQPQIATPQQAPQAAAPVVEQPVNPAQTPSVSPETFAGRLNSTDLDAQKAAIEEVAEAVKNNETTGPVLLDTQIFDALVGILNKDTSTLEGPSPEVIELRQKPQNQLSEAEKQKASTPSTLEKAEINKQFALYTIAYMQERLNNELEKRNGQTLELKDLPCIENVVDTVKSNPNPMLRISGIAALSHIAKPQYKADLTQVFELAKADEDPRVVESATKAIELLNK